MSVEIPSHTQLQQQIRALERQASLAKRKEKPGVIRRIKEAIEFYELAPADLFDQRTRRSTGATVAQRGAVARSVVQSRDAAGNKWGGRGPRPRWLHAALAAGVTLEELAVR